ncbi:unnamed protein product, partial [Symbiodinium sp. CCMP2456]
QKELEEKSKQRIVADPKVTPYEIRESLQKYLDSVHSKDIWAHVVPPAGGPRVWHWKTKPCAVWMAKTSALVFDLLDVARNGKLHSKKLCIALEGMVDSGAIRNCSGSQREDFISHVDITMRLQGSDRCKVQKVVEALVLPLDDSDEDEEKPLVKKEPDMDNNFLQNSKLFEVTLDEPQPHECLPSQVNRTTTTTRSSSSSLSRQGELNILELAKQRKPAASWGRNSKSKAATAAKVLQSSESEEDSSETEEMAQKKNNNKKSATKKTNNKTKLSKKKQEKKKQEKKKQEKKKKKKKAQKTKDTKKKKKKQDKKDEIQEKEDQDEKKEETRKRKSFGGFSVPFGPAKLRFETMMEVFYEVLVPKAATPKGAPWEVEWYRYSYSGAKGLETKKAFRQFFRKKAHKFLKDKGLE